jgi:hypothetical protein
LNDLLVDRTEVEAWSVVTFLLMGYMQVCSSFSPQGSHTDLIDLDSLELKVAVNSSTGPVKVKCRDLPKPSNS